MKIIALYLETGLAQQTLLTLRGTCAWTSPSACTEGINANALTKILGVLISGNPLLGSLQGWIALHSLAVRRGSALGFSFGDVAVLWSVGGSAITQSVSVSSSSGVSELRDINGTMISSPLVTDGVTFISLSEAPVYLKISSAVPTTPSGTSLTSPSSSFSSSAAASTTAANPNATQPSTGYQSNTPTVSKPTNAPASSSLQLSFGMCTLAFLCSLALLRQRVKYL